MFMKRPLFIAVLWGAALLPLAAQAQMRGGGGFRGPVSRGPIAPPVRVNPGFPARPVAPRMPVGRVGPVAGRPIAPVRMGSPRVFTPGQRVFVPQGRIAFNRFHNRFHHHHRFFSNTCFDSFGNPFFCSNSFFSSCFNGFGDPFFCNSPFFGNPFFGGFGLPFYDPFYTSSYSQPEPQQPAVVEESSHDRELALEVQELSDEIQAMRDEQQRRESAKNSPPQPSVQDLGPTTTLVLRDGLQLPVHNYAVVGNTIWVLDNHNTQKIPIAKLDVAATQQINDKNGVDFRLPK